MPATEQWERQPNEGPEANEAFQCYRDLRDQRSTARVAQELGKSKTLMDRWSAEHQWVRRVTAYERHLDSQRRGERETANREMERRQATQLAAAAQALTQPVRAFLERIQRDREAGLDPFADMSTAQLMRLAGSSIRHLGGVVESERLVAGLSTENVAADAPATVEEARRRAEQMSRGELCDYLLGVDDGQAAALRELGIKKEEGEDG